MKSKLILKVLVGSRAHGIEEENADWDYRGVFIVPTTHLLKVHNRVKSTHWIEGEAEDNTMWELGHYCHLALQCNPTILETLTAPVIEATKEGKNLRKLFPCFLDTERIKAAFLGYSSNQRKKMFDKEVSKETDRWIKFALAYIRVLYQGGVLFHSGTLPLDMSPIRKRLLGIKEGRYSKGGVIDLANFYEHQLKRQATINKDRFKQDVDKINAFLLAVRRKNWTFKETSDGK